MEILLSTLLLLVAADLLTGEVVLVV